MKDFFYNRHNNSFALVADGWHLENLAADWNCLDFGALFKEGFINGYLSRVRLLADAHTTCFNSSFPTISSSATRVSLGSAVELTEDFSENESSRPPSFGSLTTAAPTFTNDFCE
jgi:hypothetical protein